MERSAVQQVRTGRRAAPSVLMACVVVLTGCAASEETTLEPLATVAAPAPTVTSVPVTTITQVPVDPDDPAAVVLGDGDGGQDVRHLQELLVGAGFSLTSNGRFSASTAQAVKDAQTRLGFEVTGQVTRGFLDTLERVVVGETSDTADLAAATCVIGIIGDSLVDGAEKTYAEAIASSTDCVGLIDGLASRTLYAGWQCWVRTDDGQPKLRLVREQLADTDCRPTGLTLLGQWVQLPHAPEVVVLAVGINDTLVFDLPTQRRHLDAARELVGAGGRRIVVVTTAGRPGSPQVSWFAEQSAQLRTWCAETPGCLVADWAADPLAADPGSYLDLVNLTESALQARARLIALTAASALTPPADPAPVTPAPPAG